MKTAHVKAAAIIGITLLALLMLGCTQSPPVEQNNTTPMTPDEVAQSAGDGTISEETSPGDMIDATTGEPDTTAVIIDEQGAQIGEMI